MVFRARVILLCVSLCPTAVGKYVFFDRFSRDTPPHCHELVVTMRYYCLTAFTISVRIYLYYNYLTIESESGMQIRVRPRLLTVKIRKPVQSRQDADFSRNRFSEVD